MLSKLQEQRTRREHTASYQVQDRQGRISEIMEYSTWIYASLKKELSKRTLHQTEYFASDGSTVERLRDGTFFDRKKGQLFKCIN